MKRLLALALLSVALAAGAQTTTPGELTVTEFHHPQFDHYFITAYPEEAASLSAGNLPPWTPTGQTFKVWNGPGANIGNVCRFFSATFAPRSSHFYSGNANECPGLAAGGVWTLESANAFYMMPSPAGTCPAGTMPLFRLYNDGMSGAPNHRYTIHRSVRSTMIAAGWVPEGNGADGVFACVPFTNAPPPPTGSAFQKEVTGYVNNLLSVVSGDAVDLDQLELILGATINSLLDPSATCPTVTTTPPLQDLTSFPPNLAVNIGFGSGCTVQDGTTSATVSGSLGLDIRNLVFTDTALSGSLTVTINNVRVNGNLVANGTVQATANITINAATGAFSGTIAVTLDGLQLPNDLGASGTLQITLNSDGTIGVTTDLTAIPSSVAIDLNATVTPQEDGSFLVNSTGPSTVGDYTVQIVNLKVDPRVCETGAIGGAILFTKGGETGTITFNSSCTYEYSGP